MRDKVFEKFTVGPYYVTAHLHQTCISFVRQPMCSVFLHDGVEWRKKREFGFLGVKRRMPFFH